MIFGIALNTFTPLELFSFFKRRSLSESPNIIQDWSTYDPEQKTKSLKDIDLVDIHWLFENEHYDQLDWYIQHIEAQNAKHSPLMYRRKLAACDVTTENANSNYYQVCYNLMSNGQFRQVQWLVEHSPAEHKTAQLVASVWNALFHAGWQGDREMLDWVWSQCSPEEQKEMAVAGEYMALTNSSRSGNRDVIQRMYDITSPYFNFTNISKKAAVFYKLLSHSLRSDMNDDALISLWEWAKKTMGDATFNAVLHLHEYGLFKTTLADRRVALARWVYSQAEAEDVKPMGDMIYYSTALRPNEKIVLFAVQPQSHDSEVDGDYSTSMSRR